MRDDYWEKKIKIIEATKTVVAHLGVSNTSVQAIADQAGMSKGALYHYYPSKDAILYDLLNMNLSETTKLAETAIKADSTVEEIKALAIQYGFDRFGKTEINLVNLHLVQEAIIGNEEILSKYQEKYTNWADRIEDVLSTIYNSKPSPTMRVLSLSILAMIEGICVQELLGIEKIDRKIFAQLLQMFFALDINSVSDQLENQLEINE